MFYYKFGSLKETNKQTMQESEIDITDLVLKESRKIMGEQ